MIDTADAIARLTEMQRAIREVVIRSHTTTGGHEVNRSTAADTIYAIDADIEPILEAFCRQWAKKAPLVLIAEGIETDRGVEGVKVFPEGSREEDAQIRVIVDP